MSIEERTEINETNVTAEDRITAAMETLGNVSRETVGAAVEYRLTFSEDGRRPCVIAMAITAGAVAVWMSNGSDVLRRSDYIRDAFPSACMPCEHPDYETDLDRERRAADYIAGHVVQMVKRARAAMGSDCPMITGAEIRDNFDQMWFDFTGEKVAYDVRALRAVIDTGSAYLVRLSGGRLMAVPAASVCGTFILCLIPDEGAPLQAPRLPVHHGAPVLETVPASQFFPCSSLPHIGYHNAEQMRQCPIQAREKFMRLKWNGATVPHSSKRRGNNPRVLRQSLSFATAESPAGVLEWYRNNVYNTPSKCVYTLGRIGAAISAHLGDIECDIVKEHPGNWLRLSDPVISVSTDCMTGEAGAASFDLIVAPDYMWYSPEGNRIVMADVKASSNSISRQFYLNESDQLIWYRQILEAAGFDVVAAYWILCPDPSAPDVFSGKFSVCRHVPAVLVDDDKTRRMEWNRSNWAAFNRMVSDTPEERQAWAPHPGGWCNWCDTKTSCPLIKAGNHPYL